MSNSWLEQQRESQNTYARIVTQHCGKLVAGNIDQSLVCNDQSGLQISNVHPPEFGNGNAKSGDLASHDINTFGAQKGASRVLC